MNPTPGDRRELFDLAIVGAGIVGASVAFHASRARRVLLLEAESDPGYHTTGRSAALFSESYGPRPIRILTRASRAFFEQPPPGFADHPLLAPRGAMFVATARDRQALAARHAEWVSEGVDARWLDGEAARSQVPVLRAEACAAAVLVAGDFDIDVNALLQGFLRGARTNGAVVVTEARVAHARRDGSAWALADEHGRNFRARVVVDAAGAWLDEVAALAGATPVGIEPRRRSAFVFAPPEGLDVSRWPAVVAADESWYFKPEAGLLLGSPANADLAPPHDVQPEELDIAIGIDRLQAATTLSIRRPRRTWAGLRCFVADGDPVIGFDPSVPGFFWAGAVGGYGIQSSPAVGRLAAALAGSEAVPHDLLEAGLDVSTLAPRRTLAA